MFFNQFSFQCLCNCHDTLLLACVFEEFQSISYERHGLDCAHNFIASNVAGDAFNRVCESDVKLLTYQDHLDLIEKMMQGATASIFEKRHFTETTDN